MSLKIKKQFVSNLRYTYGHGNKKRYITIHETGNTNKGANAQAHANLQSRGFANTFHYQVDDKEAIQSFPHNISCWHAGDGRGNGNLNSIGIEICVNSDGDFAKAVTNAAALVRKIMQDEGIPIANVVQHNRWSGKNCPTYLRNGSKGVNWADFKRMLGEGKKVSKPKETVVKPAKTTNKPKPKPSAEYKGNSIVAYLDSIGADSSFGNRKKLAEARGIRNYRGTATQNLQLLRLMRGDAKPKSSAGNSSGSFVGKRVESIHSGNLRFYSRGSWSDKYVAGHLRKGYGFPRIVRKVKVGNGWQYEAKNSRGVSYYVTASPKYVRVV